MTRRLFGSPQLWNKVRRYLSQPEWIGPKNCWREAKIQIVSWSTPLQTGALEGHLRSCPVDSSGTRSCASKSCSKMMMVSAQPRIGLHKYTLPADKLLSLKFGNWFCRAVALSGHVFPTAWPGTVYPGAKQHQDARSQMQTFGHPSFKICCKKMQNTVLIMLSEAFATILRTVWFCLAPIEVWNMYTQLQNLLRKNRPTKIMQTSFFGHALGSFCNTFANFCLAPIGSLNMYTQYQNLLQKTRQTK